jgi:hypothetical protein
MVNYIIEDNIDFFQELYKSLDNEESDENKINEDNEFAINSNLCLITNQPLENNHIIMKCGHKFNYIPLYKYLINYKQKFNTMENAKQKLDINEIRCPYCRHKQRELLPYYEDMNGIKKINGINNEYIKPNLNVKNPSCCFKIYSKNNENNNMYFTCGRIFTCQLPDKFKEKDEGFYCSFHIKKTIQKIEKEEKEEIKKKKMAEKEKFIEEKLKAKEEMKKAKLEAKTQLQIQKQNQKLKKMSKIENQLIEKIEGKEETENIIIDNTNFCQSIIKCGINKGKHCSFKIFQNGLCKRHCKLIENKNT